MPKKSFFRFTRKATHSVTIHPAAGGRSKKQFFFLAYLNLILAVAILLIVALWRWG